MPRLITAAVLAVLALAVPAAASANVITPEVDCVQPTQFGYVAHYTYTASSLPGGDEFIAAGDNLSGPEGNVLSVSGVGTQGNGQQPWTETFVDGTHQQGFQVYFKANGSATWSVRIDSVTRTATATANSTPCPGGANGEDGTDGTDGQDGQDGQDGRDGDSVRVTKEEPGENCAAGGVKITVEPGTLPEYDANEYGWIVNEGDVFYVCNGVDGHDGQDGRQGEAGAPGANGSSGANGTNGTTTTVTVIQRVPATAPRACVSHRHFFVKLPKDLRGVKKIRVNFAGKVTTMKVTKGGRIMLDFRGHRCGQYAVAIHKKGHKAVKLLYTLGGAKNGGGNLTAYNQPPQRAPHPDAAQTR